MYTHFTNITNFLPSVQNYFFSFADNQLIRRVQEVVSLIFAKISAFFVTFDRPPLEMDLRPVAAFGCLAIIIIFILAVVRKGEDKFIEPPTPFSNKNKRKK